MIDRPDIIVTGATGFTGGRIVKALVRAGRQVAVLVRDPDRAINLLATCPGIEVCRGCFEDPDSLKAAFQERSTLVNVASIGFGHAPDIVNAAQDANIKRAVFFSTTAIFTTLPAHSKSVREAAEQTIAASGLSWTILRPTMIFGTPRDRNIIRLIRWVDKIPLTPVFGPGTFRMQPVFVGDLASAVLQVLDSPQSIGKAYDLSGADAIDYNGLVSLVAELLGKSTRLVHFPIPLSLALVRLSRLIPGLPNLSDEQVQRLSENKDFAHGDAATDFDYKPTPLRDALRHEIDLYRLSSQQKPTFLDRMETVRHLRPAQIAWLLRRRILDRVTVRSVPSSPDDTPTVREPPFAREPFIDQPPARRFAPGASRITLLNRSSVHRIPIDWDRRDMGDLWVTELNYFHWLSPGIGYAAAKPYLLDWIAHAPQRPRTPAWDPFAVAQRVLHWTRLLDATRDEWRSDRESTAILRSLYQQARFLAKAQQFELLGNHLVKTAAGLFAAGSFFTGNEADAWRQVAGGILATEATEQVLPDGGHYERSPMYHLFVLQDLSDVANMCVRDDDLRKRLDQPIGSMTAFAAQCCAPDGRIPLLNDCALDQAPPRGEVIDYASRVTKIPAAPGDDAPHIDLPDFGLRRIVLGDWTLWIDAGRVSPDFLPAHAHADTASVLAWFQGKSVLIDSGTYCYDGDPDRRAYDRSGRAHNVLTIDGQGSARCWAKFRVARRPIDVRASSESTDTVTVTHDGFRALPGRPTHTRRVTCHDARVVVTDTVEFTGAPKAVTVEVFWHFAPEVVVGNATRDGRTWTIPFAVGNTHFVAVVEGADSAETSETPSSRRFYENEQAPTIRAIRSTGGKRLIHLTTRLVLTEATLPLSDVAGHRTNPSTS